MLTHNRWTDIGCTLIFFVRTMVSYTDSKRDPIGNSTKRENDHHEKIFGNRCKRFFFFFIIATDAQHNYIVFFQNVFLKPTQLVGWPAAIPSIKFRSYASTRVPSVLIFIYCANIHGLLTIELYLLSTTVGTYFSFDSYWIVTILLKQTLISSQNRCSNWKQFYFSHIIRPP